MTTRVAHRLRPGDELADGTIIWEQYNDDDGTWLEFSDGDQGYVDPTRRFKLADSQFDAP